MKLIRPDFEILSDIDSERILKSIEIAGRTCYKSEKLITGSSSKSFSKMIIDRGHLSVIEHEHMSVKFIVDRGVSHELVRHRLSSFSQESTRYCNYSTNNHDNQLTFIIPCWFKNDSIEKIDKEVGGPTWLSAMEAAEDDYSFLVKELGWRPEQARSILPNSLKTEIIVTSNLRHWREIFKQRTSKAAHPQMREVMRPLLSRFKTIIPIIFDDINYED